MNKDNLLKMADHIETVPQELFDMKVYRLIDDEITHECKSVGCTIGHSTRLDNEPLPRRTNGTIDFTTWSERFTGLRRWFSEWRFLFSDGWVSGDNTPTGAAKRIRYFVEHGLPKNWMEMMDGDDPLPY